MLRMVMVGSPAQSSMIVRAAHGAWSGLIYRPDGE